MMLLAGEFADRSAEPERVNIIDPLSDERWDRFVENHPLGWICHLSGWKRVLEESFPQMKGYYLVLEQNHAIRAGLPVYVVKSWLTGNRLVSIPFATLSDPLVSSRREAEVLVTAVMDLARKRRIQPIEIRTCQASAYLHDKHLGDSTYFKHHYLLFDKTPEDLYKNFHRTCVRQRISRAENSDIEVVDAMTEQDLLSFYQMYVIHRKRLCLPPQPYSFIKALWDIFSPQGQVSLLLARRYGQDIAGVLLLKFRERVSAEYAVRDDVFQSMSPLHLLFWEGIRAACRDGFRIFDFGRTAPENRPLMDFKARWGTVVADLHHFYYPKEKAAREPNGMKSLKRRIVSEVCRYAPLPILSRAGSFIYRHMG